MARYYTNIYNRYDKMYVRGYEDNKPFTDIVHYKPYVFLDRKSTRLNSSHRT